MNATYPAAVSGCRCHRNLKTNPQGAFNTRSSTPFKDRSHFVSTAADFHSSAFTIRYLLLSGIERSLSNTNAQ